MDSVTHIVVGAAIGDAALRKKMGRWSMLLGAFLNTFPDFDLFISGLNNPKKYLIFHRAHSHAILFEIAFAFLFAGIFYKLLKKLQITYWHWFKICAVLLLSHTLMDIFTNYGTRVWLPFSSELVALNSIAILDLFLSIPIILLILITLFLKNSSALRKKTINVLLGFTIFYFSWTLINKYQVNAVLKSSLKEKNITYSKFMTNPTILNNFLWYGIAVNDDSLYIGEYSLLWKNKHIHWTGFARNLVLINSFENKADVDLLKWFSQGYYLGEKRGDTLDFYAVKFGRNNFTETRAAKSFIFHYSLYKKDGEWIFGTQEPNRKNFDMKKAFEELKEKVLHN